MTMVIDDATVTEAPINHLDHQGLVGRIARKYRGRGLDWEDLMAQGNLGLLRAIEGFDPKLGNKFSTYGWRWIRQSIVRALPKGGPPITLPDIIVVDCEPTGGQAHTRLDALAYLLGRIPKRHAQIIRMRYGLDPYQPHTLPELGLILGITKERVRQIEKAALIKLRKVAEEAGVTLT